MGCAESTNKVTPLAVTRSAESTLYRSLACALVVVAAAYWPGLSGPFIFDDEGNIVNNQAVHLSTLSLVSLHDAMVSGGAGPMLRPLAMLTFGLNHYWTGLDPFYFKLTNLCIHLLNGVLVFAVCRRLLELSYRYDAEMASRTSWIAIAAASIWLAHPAQLTSVLYVVQRMASLSATFMFVGLWFYLRARASMLSARKPWIALWLVVPACTLMAAFAKESGALLIALCFVIEVTLLHFESEEGRRIGTLERFYFIFLVIPSAALAIFLFTHPGWVTAAESWRPFTMPERVLTECRVLFLYLKILMLPTIQDLAIYYDDLTVSTGWFEPPTTLLSLLAVVGISGFALLQRARAPWFAFAVLWFLVAHAMESSFIMLELVHLHRNYVAYLGPILALSVGLTRALQSSFRPLPTGIALLLFAFAALTTWQRAGQWANPIDLIGYEVRHRPGSARAHYDLGRLYYVAESGLNDASYRRLAEEHFWRSAELNPSGLSALIALVHIGSKPGPPIDPRAVPALMMRLYRYPVVAGDLGAFRQLVTCNTEGNCLLPPDQLLAIFASALANRQLADTSKAKILMTMAPYYANRLRDLPVCLQLIQEAVHLVPDDASFRLVLAGAHIVNHDAPRAVEELRIAKSLNPVGKYNRDIRAVEKRLAALNTDARI